MQKNRYEDDDTTNVDLLYRLAPVGVGLSFLFVVVFAFVNWSVAPRQPLVVWSIANFLLGAIRLYLVARYLSLAPARTAQKKWELNFASLAAASALLWGLVALLFFPEDQPLYQLFSFVMLAGMSAGAISTMASSPGCYRIYIFFLLFPVIVRLAIIGGEVHLSLAAMTVIYLFALNMLSKMVYSKIHETRQLKHEDRYRSAVMELLAKGASLEQILKAIVVSVEDQDPEIICSIVLLDDTARHIVDCIAPKLPDFYSKVQIGLTLEADSASCIAAMHSGQRVVAEDISTHAFWSKYRDMALKAGLQSCWSEPIRLASGKVAGAFAIYHRTPSTPSAADIRRIEIAGSIAGLALERRQSEKEHELASLIYRNSSEAMVVTDIDERVISVNEAFTLITGYTLEDMLGKSMSFSVRNKADIRGSTQVMESVLATGKWQGELWNYRKNGERFACRVTINSIFDASGHFSRRVLLLSDITEQKRSDEVIWRQANYDSLTSLPNRRLFRDRLEQEIKKANRAGLHMGLMFLDLDRFKEINDSLGHDVGDRLLVEASKRICSCVRDSDTVARLGGDEFTIILPEIEDTGIIDRIADDIIEKISLAFYLENEVLSISVSIGITVCPDDTIEAEALLKNADIAMYAAKNAGRNRFSYFNGATQQVAQSRL